jgi:hypothetical protein
VVGFDEAEFTGSRGILLISPFSTLLRETDALEASRRLVEI